MLDAGLRATELLELTVANARLQEAFLKVLGKGNKERLLPIGRRCQDALREWRDRFRPQFDEKDEIAYLFLNANGQRMTLRALEEMIGRSGMNAGSPACILTAFGTLSLRASSPKDLETRSSFSSYLATLAWRW